MLTEVDIAFDELVKIAKRLPPTQWTKLKKAVEQKPTTTVADSDFVGLLLNGPTYSKKQLAAVAKTRKAINQWRTK
jgi:hypothetical protein